MVQAAGANRMGQRRHTLLFVDDEPDVLDSLRHQFHRSYRVLGCTSGKEAIEVLENDDVDLILSDQRMPGMTGDQLLRRARELKPDTIRMLFTGYADIQAVINAVNEGHIFRYILKPWDSAELEGIIRQGVEQYDLLAERRRLITELQATNAQLRQGQRRARPRRPAEDGIHRGGKPRIQHADQPGAGLDRAPPALEHEAHRTRSTRSFARSPRADVNWPGWSPTC